MKKNFLFCAVAALCIFTACSSDDDESSIKPVPDSIEVADAAGIQDALDQGVPEIKLTSALTADASFSITSVYDADKTIVMTIPAGEKKVTITSAAKTNALGEGPAIELNITNCKELTVTTPQSSVAFKGNAEKMTASTLPNTLTVETGATIGELNITKGNAIIHGKVSGFGTVADGSKVFWSAGNAEKLTEVLAKDAKFNHGVELTADITFKGEGMDAFSVALPANTNKEEYIVTPYDGYVLNGAGHFISGSGTRNVLGVYANGVVVKDLTVKQASDDTANNGIHVWCVKDVVLEGVTVDGTKKAGLVVSSAVVKATSFTSKNNSWGGVNITKGLSPATVQKPVFKLESGNIEEDSKIWVDVNTLGVDPEDYEVTTPTGETWVSWKNSKGQIMYGNSLP